MSIQILQYEFLGPIPLDEWGPPMEKLIYLILTNSSDKFNIIYVGDCEALVDKKSFFAEHSMLKCWTLQSGSYKSLYLAILPMFESSNNSRKNVINKIISNYKPPCNHNIDHKNVQDYKVKTTTTITKSESESIKFPCPCCGSEMLAEKSLGKSTIFRCKGCGMSDTRLI